MQQLLSTDSGCSHSSPASSRHVVQRTVTVGMMRRFQLPGEDGCLRHYAQAPCYCVRPTCMWLYVNGISFCAMHTFSWTYFGPECGMISVELCRLVIAHPPLLCSQLRDCIGPDSLALRTAPVVLQL